MRWNVHGKDAATGQPVVLGVDEAEATHAVQSALSKRILVSHVTRGIALGSGTLASSGILRRVVLPLMAAAVVLLVSLTAGLYFANQHSRQQMSLAVAEQNHLAESLRQTEALLHQAEAHSAALEGANGGKAAQMVAAMEMARQQLAAAQTELAANGASIAALERNATQAAALKTELESAQKKLLDAQAQVKALDRQIADNRSKWTQAEPAMKRVATLEASNKALAAQMEAMKGQLLELVAKPAPEAAKAPDDPADAAAQRTHMWALKTGYDAASDFVALRFDNNVTTIGTSGGSSLVTVTATLPANACTLTMKTDRHRVYWATLTLSFSADAPKERLAENTQLVREFTRTFAPNWKNAEAWFSDAMKQLADKDTNERLVLVGDDFKISLCNNKVGLYTAKIESPHDALVDDQ